MEIVFVYIFILACLGIYSFIDFIYTKIKNKKEKERLFNFYRANNQIKESEIERLKKTIEDIKKENQNIKQCDYALMQEKYITHIFEILEENNYPRVTKEKLTKLWEVIPYYPPDWKLRKYVVRKRDNYKCKKCGKDLSAGGEDEDYGEVHHLIPLSQNGTNEIKNLILVCHECHVKFHNRLYNFDFSKYKYEPLYGISYLQLFKMPIGNSNHFTKGDPVKLNELLKMKEYYPEEPDTDLYYDISNWEEKLK